MKILLIIFSLIIVTVSCKKKDTTAPVISLIGGKNAQIILNSSWSEPGFTATDNQDGDITKNVDISGTVNKDFAGSYEIKYTVADASGNEVSVSRIVTVYNEAKYLNGKYN